MTLVPRRSATVRVRNTSGLLSTAVGGNVSINSTVLVSADATRRFDQLTDVVEGTPGQGYVAQYDVTEDKYKVQPLIIDGGTF